MRHRTIKTLLLLMSVLYACAPSTPIAQAPQPTAATSTPLPAVPTATTLSFEPATYRDEAHGFELDYPSDWTFNPDTQIGSRGSQALLLSPGTTADELPEGGTRVSITIFQWEPKNDLAAFVTQRRVAWDSGGSLIVSEASGDLMDGRKAMDFVVRAPDGARAFFLFTELGEHYLQIAGEGDLALAAEIANTFRPLVFSP